MLSLLSHPWLQLYGWATTLGLRLQLDECYLRGSNYSFLFTSPQQLGLQFTFSNVALVSLNFFFSSELLHKTKQNKSLKMFKKDCRPNTLQRSKEIKGPYFPTHRSLFV